MLPVQIAIVEDEENYRKALQVMLNGTPGFQCIYSFGSAEAALKELAGISIDIVLIDINLPGMSGLELVRRLKPDVPRMQFLVLTVYEDEDKIFDALAAGASGYLLKSAPPLRIIDAIRELYDGGSPMSPQIARKVVASFRRPNTQQMTPYEALLTQREKEVLSLLSTGRLYKQIAEELHISVETVKSHCHNIYEKLHVTTRGEAVNKYFPRD